MVLARGVKFCLLPTSLTLIAAVDSFPYVSTRLDSDRHRVPGLMAAILFATLLASAAQEPSKQLRELNQQLGSQYQAGQCADALATLEKILSLPETGTLPGARGGVLYYKACLLSRTGKTTEAIAAARAALDAGYTSWRSFTSDSDFEPLRTNAAFKAFLAEVKRKYRERPLEWDASRPAPEFALRFDDPTAPELSQLRKEFQIDAAVTGATNDYERVIRLTLWTSRQWEHDSSRMASRSDPITILREAKAGGRFICQNYAVVLAGTARAYGFFSRLLGVLPANVETDSQAHSVAEVWLPGFRKWVLADGQYGIVPELNGIPLSALELQKAIAQDAPIRCRGNEAAAQEWQSFIIPNLYYFKIADDQRRFGGHVSRQLVLVPKGAKEPHKFAGGNESVFSGAIYTGNPASFYAPPQTQEVAK